MTVAADVAGRPEAGDESDRRRARETVIRSRTSFAAGMRILPKPRREAMYAVYAFCREVDDIADAKDRSSADKLQALGAWRSEIDRVYGGAPATSTGRALAAATERYAIPKTECLMMIEGMEMDARGPIVAPALDSLFAYTRRVAGAVGMMSMPVFGAPKSTAADAFTLALGDALQLTNILRDVEEDAAEGRIYLPAEHLEAAGCAAEPDAIATDPGLPEARARLAEIAASKFAETRAALAQLDWRVLRPALLMMGVYERYLELMQTRGWANGQPRVVISTAEKLAIAARWYAAPKLSAP